MYHFCVCLDQRHLKSTLIRLDDNSAVQRELNEAAFHAEMDLRSKQMQQNIEVSRSGMAKYDCALNK